MVLIKGLLKAFWTTFLHAALSLITGQFKEGILKIVDEIKSHPGTGEEKRALAIKLIKAMGITLKDSLLNLAIEIAVSLIKGYRP